MTIAPPGFRVDWTTPAGELLVLEPRLDEVAEHVRILAAAYNDPHNAPLLGHEVKLSETEVLDHYESLLDQGAHPFLLYRDGELVGDGDIRGIRAFAGEFAFLIASPSTQGQGLGTKFATMIHTFAWAQLPVETLYASIVPENIASRRVFEKLGYVLDTSPAAMAYADDGDVTMSIDRETFERLHAAEMAQIRIAVR